jgi:hypothetical protein
MVKKVFAAVVAATMLMSAAACGSGDGKGGKTGSKVDKYTVLKDANGKVYDLGGMEITIRDWFSSDERAEAQTEYDEARYEYLDWVQETYNFKMHTVTMGDWGSGAQDFVDYVSSNGDSENYVWTIHSGDTTLLNAAKSGLCYDLSTLDCLDFNARKFADNNVHKLYSLNGGIYGMHTGPAEPRTGVIFNRRLLTEAGINPDEIYDLQAKDQWTWDKFEEYLKKAQRDVDNDGTIDIWGLALNEGVGTTAAVFSNGGQFVGMKDGKYTYEIESANTVEALEWILGIFQKYDWNGPTGEDGSAPSWDYYQNQFKTGGAAFTIDQQYTFVGNNLWADMEDELGFVMFPKGPKGSMIQVGDDNVYVIPGCYDADRAWKIAFAYSVYNEYVPGYEDYNPFINSTRTGNVDPRAAEETVPLMGKNATINYVGSIPNNGEFMNAPLTWAIGPDTTQTISEILDGVRDIAKQYINEANQ